MTLTVTVSPAFPELYIFTSGLIINFVKSNFLFIYLVVLPKTICPTCPAIRFFINVININ